MRNLQAVLPAGLEAVTGQQAANEQRSNVVNSLGSFNTLLLVFAVAALLVGAFMIFNTFSITVAQRTRENGLLRALGATRRQVLSSVLLEAVTVGLLASAVGLGLGVAVAAGLKALLAASGLDIPAGGLVFGPRTVIIGLVAGTAVTVVAALSPARSWAPQSCSLGCSAADQPGARRAAAGPAGRGGHHCPAERHAQPQADRGRGVGADDLRRPGELRHHFRLLHRGGGQHRL